MDGWDNMAGFRNLYILGAGFSRPASMPLTNELLPLVFQKAAKIKTCDSNTELGHAELLLESLNFFFPGLSFRADDLLAGTVPEGFDFEKFLTYVSVISAVQTGTGEHLNAHGNQELAYFKRWTSMVVQEQQATAIRLGIPRAYDLFVRALDKAIVMTFNWDTLLEQSLDDANIAYTLNGDYCTPPAIPVFKLHGSIDWFGRSECSYYSDLALSPIGERVPRLGKFSKPFEELEQFYCRGLTPWIVVPSFDKLYQVSQYGELWQMLYLWFQNTLNVFIIGFSLRPDDYHTHAVIYPQLVHGARQGYIKVKVVDYAENDDDKEKIRTRFADIPNCEYWFGGFSEACLDFLHS